MVVITGDFFVYTMLKIIKIPFRFAILIIIKSY